MDAKLKHLEMIQSVIARMAGNSFLLKGWTVTIVAALFALAARDSNPQFVLLAYFPAVAFWGLDGHFLWQERLYRGFFDQVRIRPEGQIDFSMDASKVTVAGGSWLSAVTSMTLIVFYGVVALAILVVALA